MVALRDRGLCRFIGMLGLDIARESDLSELDVLLLKHNFYLRGDEPDIKAIRKENPHLGIISLEPIGRGRFTWMNHSSPGISIAAACLKYTMSFPQTDAVLVSVRRLVHLQENIRLWKEGLPVSEAERKALETGSGYETDWSDA